jgi:hypothetical protein
MREASTSLESLSSFKMTREGTVLPRTIISDRIIRMTMVHTYFHIARHSLKIDTCDDNPETGTDDEAAGSPVSVPFERQ